MKYLLGIDFGGGASKATLIEQTGIIVAENTVEYETSHPFPGACEQRPRTGITRFAKTVGRCLRKAGTEKNRLPVLRWIQPHIRLCCVMIIMCRCDRPFIGRIPEVPQQAECLKGSRNGMDYRTGLP